MVLTGASLDRAKKEKIYLENQLSRSDLTPAARKAYERDYKFIQIETGDVRTSDVVKITPATPSSSTVHHADGSVTVSTTTTTTTTTDQTAPDKTAPEKPPQDNGGFFDDLYTGLSKWYQGFIDIPSDLADKLGDVGVEFSKDIESITERLEEAAKNVGAGAGGMGEEFFTAWGSGLEVGLAAAGRGIGGGISGVGAGAGQGFEQFLTGFSAGLGTGIQQVGSGMSEGVGDVLKTVAPYAVMGLIGYAIVKNL